MQVYCDRDDCIFNNDEQCIRATLILTDDSGDPIGPYFICLSYEQEESEDDND